jgi:drug/metabolite transporter (DMT)-like permease
MGCWLEAWDHSPSAWCSESNHLEWSRITLSSLSGLVYLIVVGSLVGFVSYTWLLRVAPTSLVVTYAYVNPLVAMFLGSLIGGEEINSRVLIAGPLILSAVILMHARQMVLRKTRQPVKVLAESAGDD